MSLSAKILIGMALGIIAGIFFGEEVAFLQIIGEGFIQLLQMSVLPFVTVSLIVGLGRLTYDEALSLAKKAGAVLLVLWLIAVSMVTLMPLAFPDWESASFFSPALAEEQQTVDFLRLYIPANPFYSLANSIVPAVVLFSLMVGVALIGVQKKELFLDVLSVLLDTLTRVTGLVVQLAPIGVFAIAASAAGTMDLEELGRLQVYLLTFVAASLVLTFWVLPALVTILTPFNYQEVVGSVRSALITAFATGNHMIILPLLTERGRDLLKKADLGTDESYSAVEVIVPTSFTFPTIGMLLSLSFIPFAAWYVGSSLSVAHYPTFLISGVVSFFGGAIVAMPFLLDLLRIPADMFQLFITVDVFTGRFGTLVAAMHMWVLALLGTCAMGGYLKFHWRKLAQYAVVTLALVLLAVGGVRAFFAYAVDHTYTKYEDFVEMDLMVEPVPSKVSDSPPEAPSFRHPHISRLEEIRDRGSLRVGYLKDALPFVFRNAEAKLVGFDVEMMHRFAKDLGVSLEFMLLEGEDLFEPLNNGAVDIIVPGFGVTPGRTERANFTVPYLDFTIGFLVEDHLRDEFSNWEAIRKLKSPRIGIPTSSRYYRAWVQARLPNATLVTLDSPRGFFRGQAGPLDAMVGAAEAASAWTLVYPQYTVTVPLPHPIALPLAYVLPHNEEALVTYLNTWLKLRKKDRTIDEIFDHWILGRHAVSKGQRWSVVRDVLHWID